MKSRNKAVYSENHMGGRGGPNPVTRSSMEVNLTPESSVSYVDGLETFAMYSGCWLR